MQSVAVGCVAIYNPKSWRLFEQRRTLLSVFQETNLTLMIVAFWRRELVLLNVTV